MDVVDITETKSTDDDSLSKIQIKTEDPDATEGSSSFGDTLSSKDNYPHTSDTEVESCLYGEDSGMGIDNFGNPFPGRKKKMTAHWKNFIRPLMWRSKWAELKIIELQKQTRKYDRQLAAYEEKKKLLINHQQQSSPDFASKLSPLNSATRRKTGMMMRMMMIMMCRRRRRRRVEDVTDIKSYFSKHNLFSYHERDKSNLDGSSMAEETEKKNLGEGEIMKRDNDDDDCRLLFTESEENNDPLEQFMRKILNVKSHVQKLKSQLVSVISGNGSKLYSRENLGILSEVGDAQSSSDDDMSSCEGEANSKGMIIFDSQQQQLMSDYDDDDDDDDDMSDFVMGRGEVSSYNNNIVVPDIIESNVSKLLYVDVTMHHEQQQQQLPHSGDFCEAIMDNGDIHIHSGSGSGSGLVALEEESLKMEVKMEESGQEESNSSNNNKNDNNAAAAATATKYDYDEEDPLPRSTNTAGLQTHTPLSKGKRGKRRAGSGSGSGSGGWKNRLLL